MLEQVVHEAAEILALLGELLDEGERPGRVAIDDQVAEPEERLLLDRAEQLEHGLHRDLVLRRRRELAEEPKNATLLKDALYELTGRHLDVAYEVGEASDQAEEEIAQTEEEFVSLFKDTFDAQELEE